MSGWTPGPWRIKEGPCHAADCCDLTICGDIFMLAHINGPNYAHSQANARLIAAAPDLYAALDWLCRALVHDHNKNIDYWTEALAALAKARGES